LLEDKAVLMEQLENGQQDIADLRACLERANARESDL
jgi:hypothetical protein